MRKPLGRNAVILSWVMSRSVILATMLMLASQNNKTFTQVLQNWDVLHFYQIGSQGYVSATDPAFFPGLPLLLRGLGLIGIPFDVSGVVISLVGSACAAAALYRLGEQQRIGAGAWAAIAWLIAPMAVFTVVPYTESLFCALAFWSWERATTKRWWQMGVLAALACLVRVSGLFLWGALVVYIIMDLRRENGRLRAALPLGLPVLSLAGYAYYQYTRTGDWMAWYTAQKEGWQRGFAWPWESLMHTLEPISNTDWRWVFVGEVTSMAIGLVVTLILLWKRRVGQASWVAVQVLAFSLTYWFMSVNRAVLLWFPLWLLLGEAVAGAISDERKRSSRLSYLLLAVLSLTIQLIWTCHFGMGKWAS